MLAEVWYAAERLKMDGKYIPGPPASFSTLEELEALLDEAEDSGPAITMTPEEWQRLRDGIASDRALRRKAS